LFTPGRALPWIGGWLDPKAEVGVLEKKKRILFCRNAIICRIGVGIFQSVWWRQVETAGARRVILVAEMKRELA